MKVGSNLPKIRAALDANVGLTSRATLVERGTMPGSVTPMGHAANGPIFLDESRPRGRGDIAPYFTQPSP